MRYRFPAVDPEVFGQTLDVWLVSPRFPGVRDMVFFAEADAQSYADIFSKGADITHHRYLLEGGKHAPNHVLRGTSHPASYEGGLIP